MSNYESVILKGLSVYLAEAPTVEFERLGNGRIDITARSTFGYEEYSDDMPVMLHEEQIENKFEPTKRQAAELGHALLRWSEGNGCTPRKNSKPRKRKSARTG